MRLLTTKEAEQLYGIPADTFAQWCREGKILGAAQSNGRWQFTQDAVEQFFNDNPALRPAPPIADNPTWANFGVTATILGFAMDAYSIYNIITGGSRTRIWFTALGFSTLLWIAALYIHRARQRIKRIGYQNNTSIFEEKPRYTNRLLRSASIVTLWAVPIFLALGIIGYQVWRIIPPQQTVILVADFVDPAGIDTRDVTADLVEQMETTLANYVNIHVKRLHEAIERENGDETALTIGQRPEHKAAIVIWGHYVSPPDPELTIHFRMVQPNDTYLSTGFDQRYTPLQINQPTMLQFKLDLGKQLAQLVAFSSGLLLFETDRNKDALPFFDTAATAINTPLGKEFERAIRFYRGTNYLPLGRAREAQVDLQTLVPTDDKTNQVFDKFSLAALGNLGAAYYSLGQVSEAIDYYEQALTIAKEISDRRGEGNHLGNLGLAYYSLGQVNEAIDYYEQGLAIAKEIDDRRSQGNHLVNLGLAHYSLGQVSEAIDDYEQGLTISKEIGDRRGEGAALGNLGLAYYSLGQVSEAIGYYEQGLAIAKEIGDHRGEVTDLGNMGNAYAALGQVSKAIGYYEQGLAIAKEIGDRSGEGNHLGNMGNAYYFLGRVSEAIGYYEQGLAIAKEIGDRSGEGNRLGNIGNAYYSLGQVSKAIGYYKKTLAIAKEIGDRRSEGKALGNMGNAYYSLGQVSEAISYYEQGLAIAKEIGDRRGEGNRLGNIGNAYYSLGQVERAKQLWQDALRILEKIKSPDAEEVREQLRSLTEK